MKIITTTIEDFIKAEIAEHGHDYCEAQFLMGFKPAIVNGVWIWFREKPHVSISNQTNTTSCNIPSSSLGHSSHNLSLNN